MFSNYKYIVDEKILVNEKMIYTYWCEEFNLDAAEHMSTLTSPYMSEIFLSKMSSNRQTNKINIES